MKWLKKYELFKEAVTYSNKNIISEICISMVLLNNEFLDPILDRGIKGRYLENSKTFLTDLKNLLIAKNRLYIGKFIDGRCVVDDEISKVNGYFDSVDFDIEKDWKDLVNARNAARGIIDKLLPNKLESDKIKAVYWLGPNRMEGYEEDIVIELTNGKQFSFFLNKKLSNSKSASFNKFAEELVGNDLDQLFKEGYMPRWNKLTQDWIRIIYENVNKNVQSYIERFVDPSKINSIDYFSYFDIRHRDPKFKYLGEFMREFGKNILKFSDLMSEIWKKRAELFMDCERVEKEWAETKIVILNSKILENLLTVSLRTNHANDIKRLENGFKLAAGTVKMKLFKTLVEKMNCLERNVYYISNNGDTLTVLPSRQFFRKHYDDIKIMFDYHVKFRISEEEDNNNFNMKIKLEMDGKPLIDMIIGIKFSGSEMSGKLSASYKFDIDENFNYIIHEKN